MTLGTDTQILFDQAFQFHRTRRWAEADRLYRQILDIDPKHAGAWHHLGVLARQVGNSRLALDLIGQSVLLDSNSAASRCNYGNVLGDLGRKDEAVATYRMAICLDPVLADAYFNLGGVLAAMGALEEAGTAFAAAVRTGREHGAACINLGLILERIGRLGPAMAVLTASVAIEPGSADAHSGRGLALAAAGQYDFAASAFRAALRIRPNSAETYCNYGIALRELGMVEAAAASFAAAQILDPSFSRAFRERSIVLPDLGRGEEAETGFRRALRLDPDSGEARLGLAMASLPMFPKSAQESRGAAEGFLSALADLEIWAGSRLSLLGSAIGGATPFYLAYRSGNLRIPLSRYGDLACRAAEARWKTEPTPPRAESSGRIRLGVVSGHIHDHPVWKIVLKGIFRHLDRSKFELILYHMRPKSDAETDWARTHVEKFRQGPMPMEQWLDQIGRDRPDILFYPEIGMEPMTTRLAALRLASVQAAGWGHPVTTGLPSVDLFFSGELLEGPDAAEHYREKLVLLPGVGACTEMMVGLPAGDDRGSAKPGTDFVICQVPFKLDPIFDPLIGDIVDRVADCRLWIVRDARFPWMSDKVVRRLEAELRRRNHDPAKILFTEEWMGRKAFDAFLDRMDVYLDWPSFSGYTTAWQAAHRGIPIVTLEGAFLRQRLAAGLLRKIGQTDTIAADGAHYIAIAARLAEEPKGERRARIRAAAGRADNDVDVVRAFERHLCQALGS